MKKLRSTSSVSRLLQRFLPISVKAVAAVHHCQAASTCKAGGTYLAGIIIFLLGQVHSGNFSGLSQGLFGIEQMMTQETLSLFHAPAD
jgi:hypothetical protein